MPNIKNILLCLSVLILLASVPAASADENKINVTYIGFDGTGDALDIANQRGVYSDHINFTYIPGYKPDWSGMSDELNNASQDGFLEQQDVILCDMLSSSIYSDLNETFLSAHSNGTSLLDINSGKSPAYFDYVSPPSGEDKICTYYSNAAADTFFGLKSAENLLIYLSREYGNHPEITDGWSKIDITYVAYAPSSALAKASKTNPYAEFINFTYVPSYNSNFTGPNEELLAASESGFLSQQDVIFCDMIVYGEAFNDTFYPAHENGVTLLDVKSYDTPDYFDYVSDGNADDRICTYYKNVDTDGKGLKSAENFLIHLSREYANHPEITDEWPRINFTYVYYKPGDALELASRTNPYAEFIDYTYIPSYKPDWSGISDELINASQSGFLSQQDVIFCDMIGYDDDYNNTFIQARDNGSSLLDINSDNAPQFFDYISNGTENDTIFLHYNNMGTDASGQVNAENLMIYASKEYGGNSNLTAGWTLSDEDEIIPEVGLYHPDFENRFFETTEDYLDWYQSDSGQNWTYDPSKPTIGMWFHRNDVTSDQLDVVDALIRDLEGKDCNVVAGFDTFNNITDYYCDSEGEPLVQCVISLKSFRLNYWNNEYGLNELEQLDVPVLRGIVANLPTNPEDANRGIPNAQMVYKSISPNLDGIFEYVLVGNSIYDPDTQTTEYVPLDGQVDWISNRSIKWAELKLAENQDKKVAIIYYNYPSGKDNIGASYLDVISSMRLLLEKMDQENYTVNYVPENNSELLERLQAQGINAGSWAPGVLDEMVENRTEWGLQLIPMETYQQWFEEELPQDLKDSVIEEWGEPWSDDLPRNKTLMMWEDETGKYIVIPTVQCGNVWLMPQPARGFMQNDDTLYHSSIVPPPHQYIAFYLWLNDDWDADAIIHLGTHGTHEWLPGQAYGMNRTEEWAPLLLQDLPNIYPYIVANVGEGLTAEFRGNALIIDHLTPTLERSGSYGEIANLSRLMQTYYGPEMSAATKEAYKVQIVDEMVDLNLNVDLGLNVTELYAYNESQFDGFVKDVLHEYIEDIEGENIPYGMHILGEVPSTNETGYVRDELSAMVRPMMGSYFENNVTAAFYSEAEYPLGIPSNDTRVDQLVWEVVTNGTSVNNAQTIVYGEVNSSVSADLTRGLVYKDRLIASSVEMDRVIFALNAGFIPPGPGTDPVMNTNAVPTGRNFYGVNPELYPSEATWRLGKFLAQQMLEDYYNNNNGTYPRKVSFSRFGVEFIRDHGTLEAEAMYLLGIKPVWDENGYVIDVEAIPEEELLPNYDPSMSGRPRIDIVYTTAGMRDAFPSKIKMMDDAVKMASELEAVNYPNYVNESTSAIYDELYAQFSQTMDNETAAEMAGKLSTMRCFAVRDGTYEIGTGNLVDASGDWEDESAIAEIYLEKMGYAYGSDLWGYQSSELLIGNLRNVDASVHSDSSNLYDTLDNDDFYQYFGVLNLATRYVSGSTPDMYVSDTRDPNNAVMAGMQEYLSKNLRSRYFNPKWIDGMQESGYAGGRMMSEFVDNLWGWEVSDPELVADSTWEQVHETYVNEEMKEWFNSNNPGAYQSITGRMLEANRKGYWDASDEVIQSLTKEYVESVVENGATCCHHTCGNPMLDEYVQGMMSVTGVVSQETAEKYNKIMVETTTPKEKPVAQPESKHSSGGGTGTAKVIESGSGNQTQSVDGGYGTDLEEAPVDSGNSNSDSNYVEGYEMTKESVEDESGGMSFSGSDIVGTLLILASLGALYLGFIQKRV